MDISVERFLPLGLLEPRGDEHLLQLPAMTEVGISTETRLVGVEGPGPDRGGDLDWDQIGADIYIRSRMCIQGRSGCPVG